MPAEREHEDGSSDETPVRVTRAAKACVRCHRKKLRCFGGLPCTSCKKAHQSCDFPDGGLASDRGSSADAAGRQALERRFSDLEKLVQTICTRLPQPQPLYNQAAPYANSGVSNQVTASAYMPSPRQSCLLAPDHGMQYDFGATSSANPPFPNQNTQISPPISLQALGQPSATQLAPNPFMDPFPSTLLSPPTPVSIANPSSQKQGSAEGRLALLAQVGSRYSAPLRPLSFQPAYWENADHTRPPSPSRGSDESSEDFWQRMEVRPTLSDDPVLLGLISESIAEQLVTLFLSYCHPFLPVLELSKTGREACAEIRAMGAFLFSTVLAIASRFTRRTERLPGLTMPELDQNASLRIRRLAYAHFASSSFRRHQSLRDLQAALLLAGWGLHPGSEGPETWMTTGHCGRLALRLGLHKLNTTIGPPTGQASLDERKVISQWKTWLCWHCFDTALELNFGRPTTSRLEANEDAFLTLVDCVSLSFDRAPCYYLVALTKLTKISSAMWSWSQMLSETDDSARTSSDVLPLLTQLNGQLDQWTSGWLWIGSPCYLKLGKYVRLLKVQSEHIRLCLNALALREAFLEVLHQDSSFDRDGYVQKAAMAALDILQAFCESVSSDYQLAFCIDYITLVVGHALGFLIRLYLAPRASPIDSTVLLHYLETTTGLLESSDMSVLGQGSHISRTCKELCRVAHIPLPGLAMEVPPAGQLGSIGPPDLAQSDFFSDTNLFGDASLSDPFDLNAFLGVPAFDPGWNTLDST